MQFAKACFCVLKWRKKKKQLGANTATRRIIEEQSKHKCGCLAPKQFQLNLAITKKDGKLEKAERKKGRNFLLSRRIVMYRVRNNRNGERADV